MAVAGIQRSPMRGYRSLRGIDPFRELFDLQRNINELFEGSLGKTTGESTALNTWTPSVDIYEDENSFLIKVDLPEINKEDVKVNLDNNVLSISGERRLENEDRREGYHRVERVYGQFYRSFTLPSNVNIESINAAFKDGVLRLRLPKKEEAKPKQIEVTVD